MVAFRGGMPLGSLAGRLRRQPHLRAARPRSQRRADHVRGALLPDPQPRRAGAVELQLAALSWPTASRADGVSQRSGSHECKQSWLVTLRRPCDALCRSREARSASVDWSRRRRPRRRRARSSDTPTSAPAPWPTRCERAGRHHAARGATPKSDIDSRIPTAKTTISRAAARSGCAAEAGAERRQHRQRAQAADRERRADHRRQVGVRMLGARCGARVQCAVLVLTCDGRRQVLAASTQSPSRSAARRRASRRRARRARGIDQPTRTISAGADASSSAWPTAKRTATPSARARRSRRPLAAIAVHRQRRDRHQVIGAETVQEARGRGRTRAGTRRVIILRGLAVEAGSDARKRRAVLKREALLRRDRPLHRHRGRQVADRVVAGLVAERALDGQRPAATVPVSVTSCVIRNGFA